MLNFWMLDVEQATQIIDGAIEDGIENDPPCRKPDFSIDITPFHRILDSGLSHLASELGFSYFNDALLEVESSEKILSSLLKIDAALNPVGARTEGRVMAEFFTEAISRNFDVVVICD